MQTAAEERRPAVVRALALRGVRPGTLPYQVSEARGYIASDCLLLSTALYVLREPARGS